MGMPRRSFILIAWVALAAILMAVMAPTLSHALPRHASTITVEICSASGLKLAHVLVIGDGDPVSPHASAFEHCPFCQNGPGALAIPSSPFQLPLPVTASLMPALFYTAPTPLFAWTAAQPRGPPAA